MSNAEIEPGIVPLVDAVNRAGYKTFSSCEGHVVDEYPLILGDVAFLATAEQALSVHRELIALREQFRCSLIFSAGFVAQGVGHSWMLGRHIKNGGIKSCDDDALFQEVSLHAFR